MGSQGIVTAVVAASVAAVGLAIPASATDGITQNAVGTYKFEGKSVGTRTWTAAPCADDAPQCIRVSEFKGKDTDPGKALWSGNAYWQVGSWIMFVEVPDAVKCKDGTTHTVRINYSWDAVENTGWRSFNDPGICGGKAKSVATPFELTRLGPPPPPPAPAELPPPPAPVEVPPPPAPGEAPPLPPAAAEVPPAPAPGA